MMAAAVPVLGMLAILAETVAIGGAIGAEVSAAARLLVISMILLGMALVVVSAALPRFRELIFVPTEHRLRMQVLVGAMGVLGIGFSVTAVIQINHALEIGNRERGAQRVGRIERQVAVKKYAGWPNTRMTLAYRD
jgi:hypothetical protein